LSLRVGDWVEVRGAAEILATLDARGCLDGLPFMPQMLDSCGKILRVSKSAHKLCDTVNGTGARRMRNAVFLEDVRCDGQAFGGCEMECLIFWKEAWLKPVGAGDKRNLSPGSGNAQPEGPWSQLEALSRRNTRRDRQGSSGGPVYSCQATQMPWATVRLSIWDPRQFVEDVRSGNAKRRLIVKVVLYQVYDTIASAGLGVGSLLRWLYDTVQSLRGGAPYPSRPGRLPRQSRTPAVSLGLQPGELVKVKTHQEVLETVSRDLINRGMSFHPEMVPYCGGTFRVSKRLRRIMNEKTGQIVELKNQCLVLEGVPCVGLFAKPLLCPRGMSPYWREIWLERVEQTTDAAPGRTISSPNPTVR
jgi:hypothetical protein